MMDYDMQSIKLNDFMMLLDPLKNKIKTNSNTNQNLNAFGKWKIQLAVS